MPTLLHINTSKNRGSTGRIAENICALAKSRGWDTYIAHGCRYDGGGEIRSLQIGGKFSEYLHAIKSLMSDGHGLGSVEQTKKLITEIKDINPDIIHLHNLHGYYVNYQILFQFLSSVKTPVVWTLHDCWSFTGHCVHFDLINCEKWETHCCHCPSKSSYPRSLIDKSSRNFQLKKRLFTSVSNMTIVPVSDWLHGLVSQSFLSHYHIQTIHNGIDLNIFKPTESDFRKKHHLENKFIVLGVADGFGERKGAKDFNQLSEKLGDNVKVVMVGVRPKDKKHISDKVLAIERTQNQQQLVGIYSAADVFINPTYEDNFPTTNLEALACGTPVITYRTGGSPEAIDENTGFVVEKGNVEGLIKTIDYIRSKGKHSYSLACRERVIKNYDKNECFADYLKLYEQVIAH